MQSITPSKSLANTSITAALTPVHFLDSPKLPQTAASASNYAVSKTRLEAVIRTLQDNYAKWQLAEKRGLALCNSIELIKTRCLETAAKTQTTSDNAITHYPMELRTLCDKLAIIASIFVDIIASLREALRQVSALAKLPGNNEAIYYRSWRLQQFVTFMAELLALYEAEAEIKQRVKRNIAHCTTRAQLICCTSAWEYPEHVDVRVNVLFTFLAEEIRLAKK